MLLTLWLVCPLAQGRSPLTQFYECRSRIALISREASRRCLSLPNHSRNGERVFVGTEADVAPAPGNSTDEVLTLSPLSSAETPLQKRGVSKRFTLSNTALPMKHTSLSYGKVSMKTIFVQQWGLPSLLLLFAVLTMAVTSAVPSNAQGLSSDSFRVRTRR